MKNTHTCPKCGSCDIARVPDNGRYSSGNNIYTTTVTLFGKIPVIRYVCTTCGYVENWVENQPELQKIKESFRRLRSSKSCDAVLFCVPRGLNQFYYDGKV